MTPPSKDITAPVQAVPVIDDKGAFFALPLEVRVEPIKGLGSVTFRQMDGAARDEWDEFLVSHLVGKGKQQRPDTRGGRALLCTLCVMRPDGKTPMFHTNDIPKIQNMPGDVLTAMFMVMQEMNGLGEEGVEEAEGNSEGAASDANG